MKDDDTAPETIWLQIGDDEHCTYAGAMKAGAEISWCQDQIFPRDVRYVRADLYERELWEYRQLEADLRAFIESRPAVSTLSTSSPE